MGISVVKNFLFHKCSKKKEWGGVWILMAGMIHLQSCQEQGKRLGKNDSAEADGSRILPPEFNSPDYS